MKNDTTNGKPRPHLVDTKGAAKPPKPQPAELRALAAFERLAPALERHADAAANQAIAQNHIANELARLEQRVYQGAIALHELGEVAKNAVQSYFEAKLRRQALDEKILSMVLDVARLGVEFFIDKARSAPRLVGHKPEAK